MVQLPMRLTTAALLLFCAWSAMAAATVPGLIMDGGRRLSFEQRFSSEHDLKGKRSLFTKLVDFVAGAPDLHYLVRPYGVAVDSRGRAILADPGARGIHIVDLVQQKYKFVEHREGKERLSDPQDLAIDRQDNIYVTDSEAGKVFVFDANGKFRRTIGALKGGEGFFKRPTGIAVDSGAQRIYVSDTWRDRIYVMDMQGQVIRTIGHRGHGPAEFNYTTELRLAGGLLLVVDAMNFRVQVLELDGSFRCAIGEAGETLGHLFRPKGIAVDSEGHIYIADAFQHLVQVFDLDGHLLYYFGYAGTAPKPLQMPTGLAIDRDDRIFVVDTSDRSVLQFQYFTPSGGTR
jgi:DNA-binding beta-propeller fold protein YncE